MIAVEFDPGDTRKRLERLAAASGLAVRDVSYEVMRAACNQAVRLTFPRKKGDGTRAIEGDLHRIFWPIGRNKKNPATGIAKNWNPGDLGADVARAFKLESGAVVYADRSVYRPQASDGEMARHHEKQRNRRGKVRVGKRFETFKAGNLNFSPKMFVRPGTFNRYKRKRQARVGQQKAGWLPAAVYFAGKVFGAVKAPSWVTAQQKKHGTYKDTLRRNGNGAVEARNTTPYWTTSRRLGLERAVQRSAQKDIDRMSPKRINDLAERFNRGSLPMAA